MKMINDIKLIEAELRRRGHWDDFASGAGNNHTLFLEKDIFYCQHGYDQHDMNYTVWLEYGEDEAAEYKEAFQMFIDRPFQKAVSELYEKEWEKAGLPNT